LLYFDSDIFASLRQIANQLRLQIRIPTDAGELGFYRSA
jgi:hypothetical protein